uniref:ABC transporter channel subunit n=1 Tax=Reclinomonas americana TaxID=48483 RepID=O21279_RECAM|nr:ABC transporter channel subunit [Reclinomonas americana]AAD11906.1 ABC transporter channel subunit [Reclinomonas americana]
MLLFLFQFYYQFSFIIKNKNDYINATLFYLIILIFFPISLKYNQNIIFNTSISIIIIASFLTTIFILNRFFIEDKEEGHLLEYNLLQNKTSLPKLIIIKCFIKWLLISISLILGTFIGIILLNIPFYYYLPIILILLITTLLLILIGSIGSALFIGHKEKSVLICLFIMPFYLPILIFTTNLLQTILIGETINNQFYFISLFFLFLLIFSPNICAYNLKLWSAQ